jgi:hypothetical protein
MLDDDLNYRQRMVMAWLRDEASDATCREWGYLKERFYPGEGWFCATLLGGIGMTTLRQLKARGLIETQASHDGHWLCRRLDSPPDPPDLGDLWIE